MKVLPKRNVTFPFHNRVRGSVLWVRPNKAVKSFQAPGCLFVCLCVCFWPSWPFEPYKWQLCSSWGWYFILRSGFHLEKITLWLGECNVAVWANSSEKLSGVAQQLIVSSTCLQFGWAWQEHLVSASHVPTWVYQVGQENSLPLWLGHTWPLSWCWSLAWGSPGCLSSSETRAFLLGLPYRVATGF